MVCSQCEGEISGNKVVAHLGEKTKTSHASKNDWLIHQQAVILNLLISNLEHSRSSTPARSDPPL